MRSKIGKFAAAAAVVIVVLAAISFWPDADVTAKVYGMADVPHLLTNAKTVLIKGWAFPPKNSKTGREYEKLPVEYWVDLEKGRFSLLKPGGYSKNDEPRFLGTVSDGEYVMEDGYVIPVHGESYKTVRFRRLSNFQAQLQARQTVYNSLIAMFGSVNQFPNFRKIAEKEIDGTIFNVWQGEVGGNAPDANVRLKIESWLSPTSGQLGRVQVWLREGDQQWRQFFDIYKIERNVTPPPDIFKTEPPPGCRLENTKETAPAGVLGGEPDMVEGCGLHTHIGFTVSDSCVIVAWSSWEKGVGSQAKMFEDLEIGGELPKTLPALIVSLTPFPQEGKVTYLGRHLAYTQKDGKFYEWSIYVPNCDPLARNTFSSYRIATKYNADKTKFASRPVELSEDITIETVKEFDTWVRGAMADLSDDGKVPEHVTYENVMKLSREIRQSLESEQSADVSD
jgi:hypothetical protein